MKTTDPGHTLLKLFQSKGTSVTSASNAPLLLEDPTKAWLVTEGKLDVFAVRVVGDRPEGPRHHLFSVGAGALVLGVEPAWADEVGLLAVGMPGTVCLELPLGEMESLRKDSEIWPALEGYVSAFSSALSARNIPRLDLLLAPGDQESVGDGISFSARRGVVWIQIRSGALHFAGKVGLAIGPGEGPFPLAAGGWATGAEETSMEVLSREELPAAAPWEGVRTFQRIALEWADLVIEEDRKKEREQLALRAVSDQSAGRAALESLAGVITPEVRDPLDTRDGPLLTACRLVGEPLGLTFRSIPAWEQTNGGIQDELRAICRASAVGYRRVVLDQNWWTRDNGPLLGFQQNPVEGEEEGEDPAAKHAVGTVALLSTDPGQYECVDPESGRRTSVDGEGVEGLAPFGYQFYRSLPTRGIGLRDLWSFVTFRAWNDIRTILTVGLLGAGLGLLLPVLTGVLFDWIIPSADGGQLLSVFVALVVAAIAGATFQITRAFSVIRLHGRISSDLQMAVLHRLVHLPLPFFRRFSAGDLGLRAAGIMQIGNALSGATISSILSSLVSGGAYLLLFFYSWRLAILATLILVVNVAFGLAIAHYSLRFAREREKVEGRLSGLVLQLLMGISKLRASGTEARAFARWAMDFRKQQKLNYQVGRFHNNVEVFNSVLSVLATLLLYWAYTILAAPGGAGLSTGQFLAFNAAFGMFMASSLSIMSTVVGLLELIPLWERAKPILDAEPEADPGRPDPGELTGRIEVSNLSFRYREDGPLILHDVSLRANPGEFIALVGPSGAGKSTLLRVLLGFDMPETNSIFYDGHDLATVDVTATRRQIGVVLQSSKLTAGDMYSNIVGSSQLSLEVAWEAARMAGMEEDLKEMPMGMHTVVVEGGTTLSGGQRQRLLIARALVHKPRIIFFDEATSALDNRTQKIVTESIDRLHATRIVIAHRLSTILGADRIYVLDQGQVVQFGTHEELISQPGVFAEMAARQEA